MKPTQELIWALRRAAKRILDPAEKYRWLDSSRCNCGLLVRELLGMSRSEVSKLNVGSWTMASGVLCSASNIPLREVFARLGDLGFETGDFKTIEYCIFDGERLMPKSFFQNAEHVSAFFLRLADSLELQLKGTIESRDPISTEEPTRARIALEGVKA